MAAHDLVSLITVVDGILHPTNQEKPPPKSFIEKAVSLKNLLKKPVTTVVNRICHCSTDQENRNLDDQRLLLKSLLEKATSLGDLLEKSVMQHHLRGNKEIIEALQGEIRDAVHEAEDIIESHAMGQIKSKPHFCRSLSEVMQKFDAAEEKLTKIIKDDQSYEEDTDVINTSLSVEAIPTSSKTNIAMVGFDEDAIHLKDRLTSLRLHGREIIPIVGMGGIGKTTLARNLYNDPLIVSHFDVRAWVTVSQDYNLRAILLGLLSCLYEKISDDKLQENDSNLGLALYQRLCGRRYVVVLDDIWSEKAWDEIKHYLPNENHRSRILITSRELDVAKYPDSTCEEHQMHLLSSAQGWDLLRQNVFDAKKEDRCHPFLEEIGRKIVIDCGGLPLAISVIGGILSENKYSKDLWEQVAKDVSSVLSHRDEHFSKILSLSYDNLPHHLKPCFLYMAAFPEDFEVRGSKLVKLWAAEGFLSRSNGDNKSLEDVAEEYLKALVDRNLLSVTRKKSIGRAESYSMHDLLRDLCVRKADEEKFLRVVKNEKVSSFRRVSIHLFTEDASDLAEHLSHSSSLLCITSRFTEVNISHILSTLRMVRVLDAYNIQLRKFSEELLKLVNLRFLAITLRGSLPLGIWRLRNLQTLILAFNEFHLSLHYEAWEISGLRHIKLMYTTMKIDFKITRVHENLQTIDDVHLHDLLASNLINNIPNLRKLAIHGISFYYDIVDLSHLHKLETLRLSFSVDIFSRIRLPSCIKKVSLCNCKIPMRLFDVVGALQNVEVFKIKSCTFRSEEHNEEEEGGGGEGEGGGAEEEEEVWELGDGVEFCSLPYLELSRLNLVRWEAEYSHFPRLRHLKILDCKYLKEIPRVLRRSQRLK